MADASPVRVTMLLAEAVQVAEGKLNILGGGWSEIGAAPSPMAIAVLIEFVGTSATGDHHFELFLTDDQHQPVFTQGPTGTVAIEVRGDASVALPADHDPTIPVPWPIAVNIPGLPLEPSKRYQWNLVVDGQSEPDWVVRFRTRAAPAPPPA